MWRNVLILSWRRPLSYRNQSIDLQSKWKTASVMKELNIQISQINNQYSKQTKTTQLIWTANQLTDFYITETLAVNVLGSTSLKLN